MAVMLRVVHIPSRVVTGFQTGVYNPITGWHVLRASDAHSWVEAWAPGHGWMTFDPTPPANSPQGKPCPSSFTLWSGCFCSNSANRRRLGYPSVSTGELNSKLISSQSSLEAVVFSPCENRHELRSVERNSSEEIRWYRINTPPLSFLLLFHSCRPPKHGSRTYRIIH